MDSVREEPSHVKTICDPFQDVKSAREEPLGMESVCEEPLKVEEAGVEPTSTGSMCEEPSISTHLKLFDAASEEPS